MNEKKFTLEEIKELGIQADVFKFDPEARYLFMVDGFVWSQAAIDGLQDILNDMGIRASVMSYEGELGLKVFELKESHGCTTDGGLARFVRDNGGNVWTCDNHSEPIHYTDGTETCYCGRGR